MEMSGSLRETICSLLTRLLQGKMSEFLPCVSFPGVLKAKLPRRRKGQESSSSEVTDANPSSHLRCLLWKQTHNKSGKNRRPDAMAKQMKTVCSIPG